MYIKMQCPQCGMIDDMDDSRQFRYCRFCGNQINVRDAAYTAQANTTSSNTPTAADSPNLNIQYYSINPGVTMIVRFLFSGQVQCFVSGQRYSFRIPCGSHRITLQIGRKNYARNIFLPDNNAQVNIYASWDGRAHIEIVNPPYTPPAPVQQVVYVPVQTPMTNPAPTPGNGRICLQCGTVNDPGYVFCVQCAARLEAEPPKDADPVPEEPDVKEDTPAPEQEEQNETVCETCGRTLHDDEKFCPGCGTKNPNV